MRSAAALALCTAVWLGQPVRAQPAAVPADARRLMDDLLADTQPVLSRTPGALGVGVAERLMVGQTRPRLSRDVYGVCESDAFTIVALPERERGIPKGFDAGSPVIQRLEAERRYQFASADLAAVGVPGASSAQACADLAAPAEFFPATNAGAVRTLGQFLAWIAANPKARLPHRCGQAACPTSDQLRALLTREAVRWVSDSVVCSRPGGNCYSALLREGDQIWRADFRLAYGPDPLAFSDIRLTLQPQVVLD